MPPGGDGHGHGPHGPVALQEGRQGPGERRRHFAMPLRYPSMGLLSAVNSTRRMCKIRKNIVLNQTGDGARIRNLPAERSRKQVPNGPVALQAKREGTVTSADCRREGRGQIRAAKGEGMPPP
jgi:hypothetical protein